MDKPEKPLTKIEQAFCNLRLNGLRNQDNMEQKNTEIQKNIGEQERRKIIEKYKALSGKNSNNKPSEKEEQER